MKIDYYLIDPTRNTTILAEGNIVKTKMAKYGADLMKLEPIAEQAGFVSLNPKAKNIDIVLEMAAGEFCGNATMAAAALFCEKARMPRGESQDVTVSVSGTPDPVEVHIEKTESGKYRGTVNMPRPLSVTDRELVYGGVKYRLTLVDFGGIKHLITEDIRDRFTAELMIKQWCKELEADALGLMLYNAEENRMDPLVYVPVIDSLFWESSCASGTTALGAYFARRDGLPIKMKVKEPGGELTIEADENGDLKLSGFVRILRKVEGVELT